MVRGTSELDISVKLISLCSSRIKYRMEGDRKVDQIHLHQLQLTPGPADLQPTQLICFRRDSLLPVDVAGLQCSLPP